MNQIIFIIILITSGLLKDKTDQYGCDFETSCDVINFDRLKKTNFFDF